MYSVAYRNVAQSGSALVWGARGRGFKSRYSDQKKMPVWVFFVGKYVGFEAADKAGSTAEKRRATERRFYAIKFFKDSANKIPLFRPKKMIIKKTMYFFIPKLSLKSQLKRK